jgi:anti-sigma factor RsiW
MHLDLHQAVRQMIDQTLLGELSVPQQQTLQEHLAQCEHCTDYLENSRRVVAALGGFSFEVHPELQGKVMASLTQRAQELAIAQKPKPMGLIYLAALVLTIVGSIVVARLSALAVDALHLPPGSLQPGVVALWIVPSLCFCLLLPVLHLIGDGEKEISQ